MQTSSTLFQKNLFTFSLEGASCVVVSSSSSSFFLSGFWFMWYEHDCVCCLFPQKEKETSTSNRKWKESENELKNRVLNAYGCDDGSLSSSSSASLLLNWKFEIFTTFALCTRSLWYIEIVQMMYRCGCVCAYGLATILIDFHFIQEFSLYAIHAKPHWKSNESRVHNTSPSMNRNYRLIWCVCRKERKATIEKIAVYSIIIWNIEVDFCVTPK